MDISINEVIEALRQAAAAQPEADGFHTVKEIANASGWHRHKVCAMLNEVRLAGRLEYRRVRRTALDGSMRLVPGYRVKGSDE